MQVTIDGVEYIPVTGKHVIITLDGVEYDAYQKPVITRIVDGDGDVWRLLLNDVWDCHNKHDQEDSGGWYTATRDEILRDHKIQREYTV